MTKYFIKTAKSVQSKFLLLIVIMSSLFFNGKVCADWASAYGTLIGVNTTVNRLAIDGSGNTYVIGNMNTTTISFGGTTLTKIGTQDIFVIKLDSSGTVVWAKNYGGSGATTYGNGIAVDGSGNVYLTGYFQIANLTTPALTMMGTYDALVMKLDSSGNTTWAKNYGGVGAYALGQAITVDGSGNVYATGYFQVANMTTPALTKIGVNDTYVIKLDSSGGTTWSKNYGGSGAYVYPNGVAVDASGNVYLGGYFNTADLTTPAFTKVGTVDTIALKLDSSGNTTWAKSFGGTGASAYLGGIAIDGSGNVYLCGNMDTSLSTPALTLIGIGDAYAIKLDSSGTTTWAKNYGGSGGAVTSASAIAVDGSGNVYLDGYFQGSNLTTPVLASIGNQNAFSFKLDSSGTTTWAAAFGGSSGSVNATFAGIAVDGSGNVYLGGFFTGGNLTTPALTLNGAKDALVIKLDSSGTTTWSKNYGGVGFGGSISAAGVTKDAAGNLYVVGSYSGSASIAGSTIARIGTVDLYVMKIDITGTVVWFKNFGGAGATLAASGVAVDGSGNVYVDGHLTGASMTTPALTKIGTYDVLAIKLDSSGNVTWSKNYGGIGATVKAGGIAVDGSGNVYFGGFFSGANTTTPALTKIGTQDSFAIKLDSSGNTTWSKNYGGAGATVAVNGITVDGSGNVYLGGYFSGASTTTPALTKIGTIDSLAIKLDSSGNTTWSKNYGGAGASSRFMGVAVDGSGNVFLGGYFSAANLTTPALTRIGNTDLLAMKLDSSGNTTWSKNYGGAGASLLSSSVALDGSSNFYMTGNFSTANLTTPALTKIGLGDTLAIKIDSTGTILWSKNYGGSGALANAFGIVADGFGNITIVGSFQSQNMTTPALTKAGTQTLFIIDAQLFNTACSVAGKLTFDSANNVMVFCDGSLWQSINNNKSTACTGSVNGKIQYYSNGGSSDFVWYAGSCRSAKGSTTYGACATDGQMQWDLGNTTLKGCINGTWTSLKGW